MEFSGKRVVKSGVTDNIVLFKFFLKTVRYVTNLIELFSRIIFYFQTIALEPSIMI